MDSKLYKIVEKKQLHEMLETFESCVKLPIQVIDSQGKLLESQGSTFAFCEIFEKYLPSFEKCSAVHCNAAKQAARLGECYIFSCHGGLNHIVFPLIHKSNYLAAVLVGPFLMDEPDSIMFMDIHKHYAVPMEKLLEMYEEARQIPVVRPSEATHISRLLYYMFSSLVTDSKYLYKLKQATLLQQSKISDSIQKYKNGESEVSSHYPYEMEKTLIQKVKTGNISDAKKTLNDLLGYVLFSEGNSMEILKSRALELTSLLSRTAIEGGAATDTILKMNNQFIKKMSSLTSMETLCYMLQEIVENFTDSMFNIKPTKNQDIIKKAMQYISEHYMDKLMLEDVAESVHLTPSYLSTLFKQTCGSSFKEYLNLIRIEESKRLLSNTEYSVVDVAVGVGFNDQNYFTKVFKKYTGLTPTQFR